MSVEQNGKKLWHIQNTNILFDQAPYDLFLWAENEPTQEELAKAFRKDYGNDERMVKEWLTSSEVYAVYAYGMNDVVQDKKIVISCNLISDVEKNRVEELQKRVEHLETEVELLKELVKLQNKCPERIVPTYPSTPLQPYYSKEPTLEPPYKITCGGEK